MVVGNYMFLPNQTKKWYSRVLVREIVDNKGCEAKPWGDRETRMKTFAKEDLGASF